MPLCGNDVGGRRVWMRQLKNLRRAAGITQFELERSARVPRAKISLAESGHLVLNERETRLVYRVLVREMRKRATRLAEALERAEGLQAPA